MYSHMYPIQGSVKQNEIYFIQLTLPLAMQLIQILKFQVEFMQNPFFASMPILLNCV